ETPRFLVTMKDIQRYKVLKDLIDKKLKGSEAVLILNLSYVKLSYESIRQILIKAGLYTPKKKKIVHRRRRRMPKAGMLIHMDSSQHQWLETVKEPWWLTAVIDDANNEIPYVHFFASDTLFSNMHVIRKTIEKKGVFVCLYVDRASYFKSTRHRLNGRFLNWVSI
ncbi:MAG: hypothetical protein NC820_04665, partial [Candidatus Omnitrophica bacterium]|nr:hypothetical protein [Candidatus Omnitrophota bacterium]